MPAVEEQLIEEESVAVTEEAVAETTTTKEKKPRKIFDPDNVFVFDSAEACQKAITEKEIV